MPVEINKKLTNREKKSINQKKRKFSRDQLQIQSPENHPIKRLNSNPNEKQCKMKRKKKEENSQKAFRYKSFSIFLQTYHETKSSVSGQHETN